MYEIFEQLLQKYGLSAYKVSKETGITQSTLSDWKRGRSTPKTENMKKIADYFGVTVDYLMTGKDNLKEKAPELTAKDERRHCKRHGKYPHKTIKRCRCPLSYDGEPIPKEDAELLLGQIELMMRRLKPINKEKYNPNKNKKYVLGFEST